MKKLLLAFGLIISSLHAYSQNGYSSVFLRVTDSATFVNSANTVAKHAADYADIWYSVNSGLFWKWSTVTSTYTQLGADGWSKTGTTNLTGDATVDNGVHNLLIGDITGPYSYWDIDGSGPLSIPNSKTDGVGDPASATHSYVRHAIAGDESEGYLSTANSTGTQLSEIVLAASATSNISLQTTGILDFRTASTQRLVIDDDGSWDLGAGLLPGSSGNVLTSNGAGAAPTWQAPSGASSEFTIETVTTNYTLDATDKTNSDAGQRLFFIMDSATGVNFTVPADATVDFAIGTEIIVQRAVNTGQITFVEGGAANITPTVTGVLTDAGQAVSMSLVKTAANEWVLQNGSTAGYFIDYTTTFGGFSSNPTSVTTRFTLVGKMCTAYMICGADGTSNATSFTVTLPLTPRNTDTQLLTQTVNSGAATTTPGQMVYIAGSTTATLRRDTAGNTWGATLGKRANFTITYEIQ